MLVILIVKTKRLRQSLRRAICHCLVDLIMPSITDDLEFNIVKELEGRCLSLFAKNTFKFCLLISRLFLVSFFSMGVYSYSLYRYSIKYTFKFMYYNCLKYCVFLFVRGSVSMIRTNFTSPSHNHFSSFVWGEVAPMINRLLKRIDPETLI